MIGGKKKSGKNKTIQSDDHLNVITISSATTLSYNIGS